LTKYSQNDETLLLNILRFAETISTTIQNRIGFDKASQMESVTINLCKESVAVDSITLLFLQHIDRLHVEKQIKIPRNEIDRSKYRVIH